MRHNEENDETTEIRVRLLGLFFIFIPVLKSRCVAVESRIH